MGGRRLSKRKIKPSEAKINLPVECQSVMVCPHIIAKLNRGQRSRALVSPHPRHVLNVRDVVMRELYRIFFAVIAWRK